MIPRFSPNYSFREILSCFLPTDPKAVDIFEGNFAKRTGHTEAISFRYGRAGLYYLLKALGAHKKKVILPSYTCVVVAHAIVLSGNIPVFLDNSPGALQPDSHDFLNAIDADTIMIIPTHLFGICQEVKDLYLEIRSKFPHVFILQDCAHSFFCEDLSGAPVTAWGDGALFGMNISKLINSRVGGMLTLKDKELAKKVRILVEQDRNQEQRKTNLHMRFYVFLAALGFSRFFYKIIYLLLKKTNFLKSQTDYYDPFIINLPSDFTSSLDLFEANIGLKSFNKYEDRIRKRQEIADFYCQSLKNIKSIKVPEFKRGNTWSHFPILVPQEIRKSLIEEIEKECSVEIGRIIDYSVADLPSYQKLGHKGCPFSHQVASSIINLPLCFREGLLPLSRKKTKRYMEKIVNILAKRLC